MKATIRKNNSPDCLEATLDGVHAFLRGIRDLGVIQIVGQTTRNSLGVQFLGASGEVLGETTEMEADYTEYTKFYGLDTYDGVVDDPFVEQICRLARECRVTHLDFVEAEEMEGRCASSSGLNFSVTVGQAVHRLRLDCPFGVWNVEDILSEVDRQERIFSLFVLKKKGKEVPSDYRPGIDYQIGRDC